MYQNQVGAVAKHAAFCPRGNQRSKLKRETCFFFGGPYQLKIHIYIYIHGVIIPYKWNPYKW